MRLARSLRAKLAGLMALISTGTLLVGIAVVVVADVAAFRREMVESTAAVARVVGEYSVSDLLFLDRAAAGETLAKLSGLPNVRYACLYDRDGAVFSSWGDGRPPELDGRRGVWFADGSLHVVSSVAWRGEEHGRLYLRATTLELARKVRRHVAMLLVVLVLLVGAAVLVGWHGQRAIVEPILDLAAAMRRVSETDDYSIRVGHRRSDEVGVLCAGFNQMLDQIQMRERERDLALLQTREKSHFLAAMSHELRTPLNSVIGFSDILLDRGGLDERQRRFLSNIHDSGQHLLGIINDILDLSKVEAGRMELYPERVRVADVLDSVITIMRGMLTTRNIEIRLELDPDLPAIQADPAKLKQVFFNLLSNAVKFSPDGSVVRVDGRALGAPSSPLGVDSVALAVVDRGIGIAAADQEAVFQPFRQAEGGTARRFGGTGLGLALVKSFVERHGGVVELVSAPGEGSTFTVILPRRFPGLGDGSGPHATPAHLVLLSAERTTVERLRRELEPTGLVVVAAATTVEAGDAVRHARPAMLLVDVAAPARHVWDILHELKTFRKAAGAPVVLCRPRDGGERWGGLALDDYFIRPLGLVRLVARAQEIVPQGAAPRTVAVLDEDPAVCGDLESRLVPAGWRVEPHRSLERGLAAIAARPPQLVVVDPCWDGGAGLVAAARLRASETTVGVPLVVLTRDHLDEATILARHRRLEEAAHLLRPLDEVASRVHAAAG